MMFGLLYAILFTIGLLLHWSIWMILGFTILLIILDYWASPYIINWLYKIDWIPYSEFEIQYPYLAEVINKVVLIRGIKVPHMGIITDGNPNAFTFGWTRNNARIVITSGIFKYLNEEEQQAVVSHELGHIVHNDFILMTIAFAIPLLFYTIARWARYTSQGIFESGADDGITAGLGITASLVAITSYIAYYICSFIALVVSRIREYYADQHAGELTENPNALSTALVKIAYGLLIEDLDEKSKTSRVRALKCLGIFNSQHTLNVAFISSNEKKEMFSKIIPAVAAWDIYNPWAKYLQLFSTHPLTAKRIMRLNDQCALFNLKPLIDFAYAKKMKEEQVGKTMIPEFLTDLCIDTIPFLLFISLLPLLIIYLILRPLFNYKISPEFTIILGFGLMVLAFGLFVKTKFKYKNGFRLFNIDRLLGHINVSSVRPVPAIIEGQIVGRGIPGFILSEDLYLQDKTGLLYLDYHFGLGLMDLIFAITKSKKLIGQRVRVKGWYRRSIIPFFQIKTLETEDGKIHRNYADNVNVIWSILFFLIGLLLFLDLLITY